MDPNPLIGDKINAKRLKEIGEEGVMALICDSTNVIREKVIALNIDNELFKVSFFRTLIVRVIGRQQ